ncbi:hypothetical protein FRC12_007199 [Ceratobasidium sp. 428]|nr:hypothetical protein FRC12_007199 [Ceratobasidium sp. 428]
MSQNSLSSLSSQRVFSIPELATRVFDFSASQDRARLLRTCRMLYKIALPYVWEEVEDTRHLLLLLKGASDNSIWSAEKTESPDVNIVWAFERSHPFTRFDIYAPYVKSLDIYGRKRKHFKVLGWKVLITRARNQALLPNLHTLIIQTSCDSHGPDQPMWVAAFASPSLVNLSIVPSEPGETPTISWAAASVLMKHVLPFASKLQKIGLFPDDDVGNHANNGESHFLAMLSEDPFYEYVRSATNLRHLSGSLAWTDDKSLLILGQLPYLETITLSGADDFRMNNFKLPTDYFPSLHGLYFHNMHPLFAEQMLWTKSLLKGLTSLDLHLTMDLLDDSEVSRDEWLITEFFPCLADAPRVEKLKIYLEEDTKPEPYEIGESVLDILSELPLQHIQLRGLVLDSEALQMDLDNIWPSLTHLEILEQSVSLAGLPKFAAIPCLQHLELQLDLRRETLPELYSLGESNLTTLAASKGGKVCSKFADVDFVARALLSIAPSLMCVTWPTPEGSAPKNEVRQHECVEFLNGQLSSLREINMLRSM